MYNNAAPCFWDTRYLPGPNVAGVLGVLEVLAVLAVLGVVGILETLVHLRVPGALGVLEVLGVVGILGTFVDLRGRRLKNFRDALDSRKESGHMGHQDRHHETVLHLGRPGHRFLRFSKNVYGRGYLWLLCPQAWSHYF